jgi:hypothetical protein
LHEGGFHIATDPGGERRFLRPDGRMIPRSGYRLDDVLDDGVDASALCGDDHTSAEAWLAAVVNQRNISADAGGAVT